MSNRTCPPHNTPTLLLLLLLLLLPLLLPLLFELLLLLLHCLERDWLLPAKLLQHAPCVLLPNLPPLKILFPRSLRHALRACQRFAQAPTRLWPSLQLHSEVEW